MKKIGLLLLFSLNLSVYVAQNIEADYIETPYGKLIVQPIFHGSMVLKWNDKTIFVDPYNGAKRFAGFGAPDLILITDIHPDHLDLETLSTIDTSKAMLIVPKAVAEKLPAGLKRKAKVLINEKSLVWESGISITAVPMYNLPQTPDAMHTKGRGNGYLLNIDGKNIYISGDTEDIAEMRALKNIDIAFVCMNLPYTMDISQAASAVLEFKPKVVYPYHYRGQDGLSDTQAFKNLVDEGTQSILVELRDWYRE